MPRRKIVKLSDDKVRECAERVREEINNKLYYKDIEVIQSEQEPYYNKCENKWYYFIFIRFKNDDGNEFGQARVFLEEEINR